MATRKSQRIAIWVIAITMLVGTIGGFAAMIVAPGNEAKDLARFEAEQAKYSKEYEKYSEKIAQQGDELSNKYYEEFSRYAKSVSEFDPGSVDELNKQDLKVGDGAEITDDKTFAAYYIGWTPKGEIFDQSIEGDKLKPPFVIEKLADGGVIEGWQEGLLGMKIGGVRELTIPSEMAYGEQGSGETIPPNTPLKFIVMAIERPEKISEPEMSEYLSKEYQRRYGISY